MNNKKAQGTVEYLVIVAVVVVVSLVVVGLVTNMSSSSQQVINSSSKIGTSSGGGINIIGGVIDSQGDALIKLNNTSSDPITLTKISVGGVDNNYLNQIVGLDSGIISLSGLASACPCGVEQKMVTCEYIFSYIQNGITKTVMLNKTIECVADSVPVDISVVFQPIFNVVVIEDGTSANPWIINDCLELQDMNNHLDGNYILGGDINCYNDTRVGGALYNGGAGFKPIGYFRGNFNGNNNTISDLIINKPSVDYVGLFSYISGQVSNLSLININVNGNDFVGGFVGQNFGTISNLSLININVNGHEVVGGLAGYTDGTIINSYSTGTVVGYLWLGGLVGDQQGLLSNSYSTVNVSGTTFIGGLAGDNLGTIINSYSTGRVTGTGWVMGIGGFVGESYGTITNSYWDINRAGKTVCCGTGTDSCTDCFGKNLANSDPNAFFSNVIGLDYNVPMQHNSNPANDWTFGVDKNWVRIDNNYPKLSGQ